MEDLITNISKNKECLKYIHYLLINSGALNSEYSQDTTKQYYIDGKKSIGLLIIDDFRRYAPDSLSEILGKD